MYDVHQLSNLYIIHYPPSGFKSVMEELINSINEVHLHNISYESNLNSIRIAINHAKKTPSIRISDIIEAINSFLTQYSRHQLSNVVKRLEAVIYLLSDYDPTYMNSNPAIRDTVGSLYSYNRIESVINTISAISDINKLDLIYQNLCNLIENDRRRVTRLLNQIEDHLHSKSQPNCSCHLTIQKLEDRIKRLEEALGFSSTE